MLQIYPAVEAYRAPPDSLAARTFVVLFADVV